MKTYMNGTKWTAYVLAALLGLASCGSDEEEIAQEQSVKIEVTTGEATAIGLTTATVKGSFTASAAKTSEAGVAYWLADGSADVAYVTSANLRRGSDKHRFSVSIDGLVPDAEYHYYAYVKDADGQLIASPDEKTFHTVSPAKLLESCTLQWACLHDATVAWTLDDSLFFKGLKDKQYAATFGIAWSEKENAVTPVDDRFTCDTKAVTFDGNATALTRLVDLTASTTYYYTAFLTFNGKTYVSAAERFDTMSEDVVTGHTPDGVQAVDMGLPSGKKWANMNMGASKASDIGLYFAWGETEGYVADGSDGHLFGWDNYQWCNGSRTQQTKYCTNASYGFLDEKTVLELTDDAAFVGWGEQWRMPTAEEMKELVEGTTSAWAEQDGTKGYLLTSKTNGNTLFLPAGGCRVSESRYEDSTDCYYWASTVDRPSPYASRYLRFYAGRMFIASLFRYYGMNVRAVQR